MTFKKNGNNEKIWNGVPLHQWITWVFIALLFCIDLYGKLIRKDVDYYRLINNNTTSINNNTNKISGVMEIAEENTVSIKKVDEKAIRNEKDLSNIKAETVVEIRNLNVNLKDFKDDIRKDITSLRLLIQGKNN